MTQPCPPSPVMLSVSELTLGTQAGWEASVASVAVDDAYIYATHCFVGIENRHDSPQAGELVVYPREEFLAGLNPTPLRLTTGWQPSSVASLVRSDYRRVFVVNYHQNSYSVSMFDRDTWALFPDIHLGQVPIDVAVHAKRGRAYVSNWFGGSVHAIDAKTGALLADERIEVGKGLVGMTVDEATDMLFVVRNYHVSAPFADELVVIDLATNTVSRRCRCRRWAGRAMWPTTPRPGSSTYR